MHILPVMKSSYPGASMSGILMKFTVADKMYTPVSGDTRAPDLWSNAPPRLKLNELWDACREKIMVIWSYLVYKIYSNSLKYGFFLLQKQRKLKLTRTWRTGVKDYSDLFPGLRNPSTFYKKHN